MIILVYGGSSCHKSLFAESLCLKLGGDLVYLATMRPYGKEGEMRVEKHRNMRKGKGFSTLEKYTNLEEISFVGRETLLLECVGNLVANEMFDEFPFKKDVANKVVESIYELSKKVKNLVVVSNNIGNSVENDSEENVCYIKNIGEINQGIAKFANEVYEVVVGLPQRIK